MAYLLEIKEMPNKLSFIKEVKNLEFFDMIRDMDTFLCNNPNKRDKILKKIGKKLFREHPEYKKKNNILQIKRKDNFYKNTKEYNLIITVRDIQYIFSLKIIKPTTNDTDNYICPRKKVTDSKINETNHSVLSQDEIDKLLLAISPDEVDRH
jgi:hypothetical protein